MAYPDILQRVKDLITGLTDLDASLIDRIYPVGSIYMSMNSTNPATLLGGGEWEALPTGRVLVGAGTGYTAGGTGGNKTVTLTVDQMPSHNHANTLAEAGGHSHDRGSMEIYGEFGNLDVWGFGGASIRHATGAFTAGNASNHRRSVNVSDNPNAFDDNRTAYFNASRNWTGATNTVANHNHTITNASTGGGSAVNIEQPWLAVYMWKRTK